MIFSLLNVPAAIGVAGVVVVIAAESLVRRLRLFGAGIEEGLETAGLLMIVFELVDGTTPIDGVRPPLLIGLALLRAGYRFLNPLLIALSAVAASVAIDSLVPAHSSLAVMDAIGASSFCFVAATAALYFGQAQFRRPSYDSMLDWLVVAMPLCGYLWLQSRELPQVVVASSLDASLVRSLAILLPVLFGTMGLLVGIRRRSHAPLLGFIVCVGCVGYELRNLTGLSLEVRLIVWGTVGLGATLALGRYLRKSRAGITSERIGRGKDALGVLQLVGTGALTPTAAAPAGTQFKGEGGTFGGGGASGGY